MEKSEETISIEVPAWFVVVVDDYHEFDYRIEYLKMIGALYDYAEIDCYGCYMAVFYNKALPKPESVIESIQAKYIE